MKDRIIIAMDVNEKREFDLLAKSLENKATYLKIGMECHYSLGPDAISSAKDRGFKVFLDLKLHDIPNTVAKSVFALTRLGVDMINVHSLGGLEMMKAAKRGLLEGVERYNIKEEPLLIAVTHLTSLDQKAINQELGVEGKLGNSVRHLARLAKEAGLGGVVSSAKEVRLIKEVCGNAFKTVTPGIRLPETGNQDQKRVVSPKEALALGTDYMVIGRSVTQSSDPGETFQRIIEEII